jgi:hypothetical protein
MRKSWIRLSGTYTKATYGLFMLMLPLSVVWSDAANLLSQDVTDTEVVAEFRQDVSRSTDTLERVRLYYMGARDCQTGYMGQYEASTRGLRLEPNQGFSLTSAGIYQTGEALFSEDKMPAIQAVLVLFIGENRQVSRFLGSCRDALINCCIPIDCSSDTHTCLPASEQELQMFFLGK